MYLTHDIKYKADYVLLQCGYIASKDTQKII